MCVCGRRVVTIIQKTSQERLGSVLQEGRAEECSVFVVFVFFFFRARGAMVGGRQADRVAERAGARESNEIGVGRGKVCVCQYLMWRSISCLFSLLARGGKKGSTCSCIGDRCSCGL